jgi:hypothetical protein
MGFIRMLLDGITCDIECVNVGDSDELSVDALPFEPLTRVPLLDWSALPSQLLSFNDRLFAFGSLGGSNKFTV